MTALTRSLFFLALGLLGASACAETICIKNKQGVEEAWTIDSKSAGLIKTSEKCEPSKSVESAGEKVTLQPHANQAVTTRTLDSSQAGNQSMPIAEPTTAQTVQTWVALRTDQNMRLLIDKWAKGIGWTLIWAVDKDIPMESNGSFNGNFKTAVRALLSSTELSDFTIKPCFYTNNVVRVVKETTKCNPNEG